jgi:hypothetical protein
MSRSRTELDGYTWEVALSGSVVELSRTRFQRNDAPDEPLSLVAVGEWSGERIEIRRFLPNRGDALRLSRALPILSEMIRIETQS